MPIYHIKHTTRYHYPSSVSDSANQIILSPQSSASQEIISHQIRVNPETTIDSFFDYFGNKVGVFTILQPHTDLTITVEAEVETKALLMPSNFWPAAAQWQNLEEIKNRVGFLDFIKPAVYQSFPELKQAVDSLMVNEMTIMEATQTLSAYVYENIVYQKGVTDVETDIDKIWELKAGVCQDFTHLLIEMLRIAGIPARYISGYICPMGNELRGVGATHAWVESYIPDYGWLGVDPTNNCIVNDRHIKIAFGRDFNDCTPVKGTYKGSSAHSLNVSVVITNEKIKAAEEEKMQEPVYVREVNEPVIAVNSYQRFLEMQQQQQQQQ